MEGTISLVYRSRTAKGVYNFDVIFVKPDATSNLVGYIITNGISTFYSINESLKLEEKSIALLTLSAVETAEKIEKFFI